MLFMTSRICYAQKAQNLALIYDDWELSIKMSTDSILIFHSKNSENKDGVISIIEHYDSPFCPTPPNSQGFGTEKWTIIKPLKRIERMFFDEKDELIYSCLYQISHLEKNYLELNLISEYFDED